MKFLVRFILFNAFVILLMFPLAFYISYFAALDEFSIDTIHFIFQLGYILFLIVLFFSSWLKEKVIGLLLLPRQTAQVLFESSLERRTARLTGKSYVKLKAKS